MSGRYWPDVSLHKSKDTEDHALALLLDLQEIDAASDFGKSRLPKFPPLLEKLISNGISEGLAEASSIGYSLVLTSECDKQRLHDIVFKKIETQAGPLARDQVPQRVYHGLANSYRRLFPKLRNLLVANGLDHSEHRFDVALSEAILLAHCHVMQERGTYEDEEARAAMLQEEKVSAIAIDVADCDGVDEHKQEEVEGAKASDTKGVEERKDEGVIGAHSKEGGDEDNSVESGKSPELRESGVKDDIYNPNKDLHEPLAHSSPIVFKITSQAAVNVLYEMNSRELFQALCNAIRKKKQKFSGTSYLSNVSLSDDGNVAAVTHNDKAEDLSLLSKMSDWDSDIIDNDRGMNFGSSRYYPLHIIGFKKEDFPGGVMASRKQKAMLISEMVRVNLTTLPSLRIHHIKNIYDVHVSEEGRKPLAICFYDLEQAYAALSRGINYNGTHFDCEIIRREYILARCKYCQANGHSHKVCSSPPRCGKCAQQHKTKYCKSPHEKCALCDGWGHGSRSSRCPVKQAEKNNVFLTPLASRQPQAPEQTETTAPVSRLQEINDAAYEAVDSDLFSDAYTSKLQTTNLLQKADQRLQRIEERFQRVEDLLESKPESQNTNHGQSRKRAAPEPLVNGASDARGKSSKRRKRRKQVERDAESSARSLMEISLLHRPCLS